MQKVINIGNGRETIDINETVTIIKHTRVLGSREPIATGRIRNCQYITGSKANQGQVEGEKPEPRIKTKGEVPTTPVELQRRRRPGTRKTGPSHTMSIIRNPAGNKLSWQQASKQQSSGARARNRPTERKSLDSQSPPKTGSWKYKHSIKDNTIEKIKTIITTKYVNGLEWTSIFSPAPPLPQHQSGKR